MSAIGANRGVQIGSLLLLMIVLLLVFRGCGSDHRTTQEALSVSGGDPISPALAQTLGIEGDTEADTVKTLVAEVRKLRDSGSIG